MRAQPVARGALHTAASLAVLPLDAAYACYVEHRRRRWEARQRRDVGAVLAGAAPFSVGEGRTAFLAVHGFADSPAVWRPLAESFARQGCHVHALRLPGAAEPCEQAERVSLERWSCAIADALRELRRAHSSVWLLGHSLGAALVLKHLADAPVSAEGAILLAPLVRVSRRRSPLLPPEAWFRLLDPLLRRTRWLQSPFGLQALDPSLGRTLPRDAFFPRSVFRALFELVEALEGSAPRITAPLLMINCARDKTVDPDAAEAYFRACGASRKTLLRRSDCGHALPVDQGWKRMGETILRFVREQDDQ